MLAFVGEQFPSAVAMLGPLPEPRDSQSGTGLCSAPGDQGLLFVEKLLDEKV